jgi:hypothetical protein
MDEQLSASTDAIKAVKQEFEGVKAAWVKPDIHQATLNQLSAANQEMEESRTKCHELEKALANNKHEMEKI